MAEYGFKTRVTNISGKTMDFGFLGDNGIRLANNASYEQPGVLPNDLNPLDREGFNDAVSNGYIKVEYLPSGQNTTTALPIIVRKTFTGGASTGASFTVYSSMPTKMKLVDVAYIISGTKNAGASPGRRAVAISRDNTAITNWTHLYLTGSNKIQANQILRPTGINAGSSTFQTTHALKVLVTATHTAVGATGEAVMTFIPVA